VGTGDGSDTDLALTATVSAPYCSRRSAMVSVHPGHHPCRVRDTAMKRLAFATAIAMLGGVAAAAPIPPGLSSTPTDMPFLIGPQPVGHSCRHGVFQQVTKGQWGFHIQRCAMSIAQCQAAGGDYGHNFQGDWKCIVKP